MIFIKISKKILAAVLAALMAISMMPFTAFTAFAASPTAAQALTPEVEDGIVYPSEIKVLRYAGKEWYVIGSGSTGVQLASGAVSKEDGETTLVLMATEDWGSKVKFANSDNNDYAVSNLKTVMENYVTSEQIGTYYTGSEAWLNDLVAPRTLEGGATQWETGFDGWKTEDKILGTTVTDATLWPLSAAEANQVLGNLRHRQYQTPFLLRTPAPILEGYVRVAASDPGYADKLCDEWVQHATGVRPALCLNVTDDMFVTQVEASYPYTYELRKHDFGYTASGATLTAQCSSSVCELNGETFNLTISASDKDYDGNAYSGASISDTTDWTAVGLAVPTIQYEGTGSTTYAKSATAPTDAGTYVATISAGGATASAAFSIAAPAPVKPTATVTEVPISVVEQYFPGSNLDVAYQFVANNDGDDIFKTYNADFVVSFDKAIPQGAVKLFGQYGQYPLTECPITKDLAANEEYRLLKDAMGMDMTYQQILDLVGTFYCGAQYTAAAAGATMTIKLAIYETAVDPVTGDVAETGTEVEIEDAQQTDTAPALPQATVTDITNTEENELGLDAAYKFEAPAGETAYDDEYCDFIIRFDQDVTSDDIQLWGKYGAYDWTNLASEASGETYTLEAGKDYYLLRDVIKWPMTYAQIRAIGTFYCGVNSFYGANGATMDVELALYEEPAEGEEPAPVVLDDEEFVAPEKPAPVADEVSITTADEIDVNLYFSDAGEEETVEYTINTTPDEETNVQDTFTVDFDSLPEVGGKRKLVINVAPAQINDNIDIVIRNAAGDIVRTYENYSVATYCEEIIAGNFDAETKALAQATLDYGKACADFFGYNAGAFDDFSTTTPYAFDASAMTAYASGIIIEEVRYRCVSVPELRFVVDMPEEIAATLTATTDKGYAAKFIKVEDKVVLEVTGIPAAKLDETITINVSNGAVIEYTPLAYAMVAAQSNDPALANLGNYIGHYFAAAKAVFA